MIAQELLYRYDEKSTIGSDLDPIEDILNLVGTLKSKEFTDDLLRSVYGITDQNEIRLTSRSISLHANSSVEFAKQAFEGPSEISFLPLYYSTLNLAKIYLLFLGKRIALEHNMWHGARYDEKQMTRNFLNQEIFIKNRGTIPLYYSTITGKSINKNGFSVNLGDIYPYIISIGAEYGIVTKDKSKLLYHSARIIRDNSKGHYLQVEILDPYFRLNPPRPKTLRAYPGLKINDPKNPLYITRRYPGNYDKAKKKIISNIRRYLTSDVYDKGRIINTLFNADYWMSFTPISGKEHIFNEEMCIMLAFFHLSNVVRYNPEHLNRLMNSKYWTMISALRKHGYLRFLTLMWGNYNKTIFGIR